MGERTDEEGTSTWEPGSKTLGVAFGGQAGQGAERRCQCRREARDFLFSLEPS